MCETLEPFCFLVCNEFTKTRSIKSKCVVVAPENQLFAGVSVHLSTRKFYRLGSEGVKPRTASSFRFTDKMFFVTILEKPNAAPGADFSHWIISPNTVCKQRSTEVVWMIKGRNHRDLNHSEPGWPSGKALGWFASALLYLEFFLFFVFMDSVFVTLSLTVHETLKRFTSLPI